MPGPKAVPIVLSEAEQQGLDQLVKRHSTAQQIAKRGRIVLLAAAGCANAQIATSLALDIDSVRRWRHRWRQGQAIPLAELSIEERLADLPRAGAPARISADQVCQMMALACEPPADSQRPISHWTGRELADESIPRGVVTHISPRHAARLLKICGH